MSSISFNTARCLDLYDKRVGMSRFAHSACSLCVCSFCDSEESHLLIKNRFSVEEKSIVLSMNTRTLSCTTLLPTQIPSLTDCSRRFCSVDFIEGSLLTYGKSLLKFLGERSGSWFPSVT